MKKAKSIYEQPRRYAKKCHIPINYARRICKYYLKQHIKNDLSYNKNSKCPICSKQSLEKDWREIENEYGEFEDCSFIHCASCGNTFEYEQYPNLEVDQKPIINDSILSNYDLYLLKIIDYDSWISNVQHRMKYLGI